MLLHVNVVAITMTLHAAALRMPRAEFYFLPCTYPIGLKNFTYGIDAARPVERNFAAIFMIWVDFYDFWQEKTPIDAQLPKRFAHFRFHKGWTGCHRVRRYSTPRYGCLV